MHTVLASPVAGHCRKIGSRTHVANLDPGLLECFRVRRRQGSDKGEPCTSIPVYQRGSNRRMVGEMSDGGKLKQRKEMEIILGGCDRLFQTYRVRALHGSSHARSGGLNRLASRLAIRYFETIRAANEGRYRS